MLLPTALKFSGNIASDVLTPFKICFLLFVKEFLSCRCLDAILQAGGLHPNHKKTFFILALRLLESPELSLRSVLHLLKSQWKQLHPRHVAGFLESISRLPEWQVETLLGVISKVDVFLMESRPQAKVERSAVIGLYIRRMNLAFHKLGFSEVVSLLGDCQAWASGKDDLIMLRALLECSSSSSISNMLKNPAVTPHQDKDVNASSMSIDSDVVMEVDESIQSPVDENVPLRKSGGHSPVQTPFSSEDTLVVIEEGKVGDDWPKEGEIWSRRQAEMFLSQQGAYIIGDFKEALEPQELERIIRAILHSHPTLADAHFVRFLNYLRVQEVLRSIQSLRESHDHMNEYSHHIHMTPDKICVPVDDVSKATRYAPLNLVALLAAFGHREEAEAALLEAVSKAQNAGDDFALQNALCWLCRISPPELRAALIEQSVVSSLDQTPGYLTAFGLQSYAKERATKGLSPSWIFQIIFQSDLLHGQLELCKTSLSMSSALWSLYGKPWMATFEAQMILGLNHDWNPTSPGLVYLGEHVCLAAAIMASLFAARGEWRAYKAVLSWLMENFPEAGSSYSHLWMEMKCLTESRLAIMQGHWNKASGIISKLAVFSPCWAQVRKAELLMCQGDMIALRSQLNTLKSDLVPYLEEGVPTLNCAPDGEKESSTFLSAYIQTLLLEAQLCFLLDVPESALESIAEAMVLSTTSHLHYWKLLSIIHMAQAQLLLGLPRHALRLVNEVEVGFMAKGDIYIHGCLWFLRAKCLLRLSKETNAMEMLHDAMAFLDQAANAFTSLEYHWRTREVLYVKSMVHHSTGDIEARNKAAFLFRSLDHNQPISNALCAIKAL